MATEEPKQKPGPGGDPRRRLRDSITRSELALQRNMRQLGRLERGLDAAADHAQGELDGRLRPAVGLGDEETAAARRATVGQHVGRQLAGGIRARWRNRP